METERGLRHHLSSAHSYTLVEGQYVCNWPGDGHGGAPCLKVFTKQSGPLRCARFHTYDAKEAAARASATRDQSSI